MSSTTATAVEEEAAESAEAEGQSKAMSVTVQDIEGDGSLISDRARSMDERLRRLRQWMAKKGGAEPAEPTTTGSTASDTLKSAASTLNAVKGMALDHEDMDIDSSSDDGQMATNQTTTEPVPSRIVLPPPQDQQMAVRPPMTAPPVTMHSAPRPHPHPHPQHHPQPHDHPPPQLHPPPQPQPLPMGGHGRHHLSASQPVPIPVHCHRQHNSHRLEFKVI